MKKPLGKNHPLIKNINNSLMDLPTPMNISMWWNFGSLLGSCLMIQIITGLFLAMHYTADIEMAFKSVVHICWDVNNGWLIRTLHMNEHQHKFRKIFKDFMQPSSTKLPMLCPPL